MRRVLPSVGVGFGVGGWLGVLRGIGSPVILALAFRLHRTRKPRALLADWPCAGELASLGPPVSSSSVRNRMRVTGLPPAGERAGLSCIGTAIGRVVAASSGGLR
jgi:hypothetical protein